MSEVLQGDNRFSNFWKCRCGNALHDIGESKCFLYLTCARDVSQRLWWEVFAWKDRHPRHKLMNQAHQIQEHLIPVFVLDTQYANCRKKAAMRESRYNCTR